MPAATAAVPPAPTRPPAVGSPRRTARNALGVMRAGVGVLSLVAPSSAARTFGVDPERSNPWLMRLFASREIVLAALLLGAKGPQVRAVALAGAAIDGIDVASSGVEMSRGRLGSWTVVSGALGAVLFTVLGLLAAREA